MTESGRSRQNSEMRIGLCPSLQPVKKPISDFRDHRLHGLDRAALEGLVDKVAQAAVFRIVVAEHVERQKTDRPRQEPQYLAPCNGLV